MKKKIQETSSQVEELKAENKMLKAENEQRKAETKKLLAESDKNTVLLALRQSVRDWSGQPKVREMHKRWVTSANRKFSELPKQFRDSSKAGWSVQAFVPEMKKAINHIESLLMDEGFGESPDQAIVLAYTGGEKMVKLLRAGAWAGSEPASSDAPKNKKNKKKKNKKAVEAAGPGCLKEGLYVKLALMKEVVEEEVSAKLDGAELLHVLRASKSANEYAHLNVTEEIQMKVKEHFPALFNTSGRMIEEIFREIPSKA